MSATTTNANPSVAYGTFEFNPATMPEVSVLALLRKGFAHLMGNEAASRVTAWKDAQAAATPPVVPTAEDIAAYKAQVQSEFMAALAAGTIGAGGSRGPRGTAAETVAREFAEKEVRAILTQNGLTMPSKDAKVSFPNGDAFTRKELIDRRLAKHGDRLQKEAEAELKARARKAEKEVAAAKASGSEGADALGL